MLETAKKRIWPVPDRPFAIAVALHHGIVTCGNIGIDAQRDATIIGDTVNTVFRIETVMKPLGQKLAASRDFLNHITAETIALQDLGDHQLKGKNQPVRLFGLPA
jgi:adenylate cyclase